MSKTVKTVASIALPIVGNMIAPGIGGAIGGAIGGGINGGIKGAVLGGITGYATGGTTNALIGKAAEGMGPTITGAPLNGGGSGIMGAVTGGGVRALGAGISNAAAATSNGVSGLLGVSNQLMTQDAAEDAKKAAGLQVEAIDRATATQAPYNKLGADAAAQIEQIQNDPGAYVQNNPFYASLADDAERRLMASEAAKGRAGSGGTKAALQDRLLQLGTGLVQGQVGTLQSQVNSGQTAATNTSNLQAGRGTAEASGVIGAGNAMTAGYSNQIQTLLALQNAQRAPMQPLYA